MANSENQHSMVCKIVTFILGTCLIIIALYASANSGNFNDKQVVMTIITVIFLFNQGG